MSQEGQLLYRNVLTHSHADRQPFTGVGGPVPIPPDTVVWVRVHVNAAGYGTTAFKGSPASGFIRAELAPDFAPELANQPPLPGRCEF